MVPVSIAKFEVCLTSKCEQGYFVQDGVQPSAFYAHMQVAEVFRAASVTEWGEGGVNLLGRSKSKRAEEAQVAGSEIRTCFAKELEFVQGHGDIPKL